jgi:hypothetical protein
MTPRKPAPVIDNSDRQWHWDRKIPVALIVTLVLTFGGQTCAGVWWASKADSRIDALERQSTAAAPLQTDQGTRLTRVEVKLDNLADGVTEIKSILRKEPTPRR